MRKTGFLLVLIAMLGLSVPAAAQWEDDGFLGFGEESEMGYGEGYGYGEDEGFLGLGDEGFLGDEGLYGDEGYGYGTGYGYGEGGYYSDDYGTYNAGYDWQTDDREFEGWYGESDEGWFDF